LIEYLHENPGRMYGALLASQSGRDVDIINSFELPLSFEQDGNTVLDKTFLLYKLEQCKFYQ
jgi:COP9 signalosome complex subunit 6